MDPSAAGPSAADWLGAIGGLIGGLGAVGAACVAVVAITRQGRSSQAAMRAQSEATRQAMAHERTLAHEDRLWQRRAELYTQVMRPITEVHAEKTRDIIGDITMYTDPRPDAMTRYEEVLALRPQVQVLASFPVRRLVQEWVEEMRLSFDGPFQSDYVRKHLMRAHIAHERLADAVRAELGVTDDAQKGPGFDRPPTPGSESPPPQPSRPPSPRLVSWILSWRRRSHRWWQ
jgi:hypothetical protein